MQLQAFELNSCSLFIIRTIPNKNPPIHKYNKHINERGDGSDIVCVIVPNQKSCYGYSGVREQLKWSRVLVYNGPEKIKQSSSNQGARHIWVVRTMYVYAQARGVQAVAGSREKRFSRRYYSSTKVKEVLWYR